MAITNAWRRDPTYYQRIGQIGGLNSDGGAVLRDKMGLDYYSEIGKLGAEANRRKRAGYKPPGPAVPIVLAGADPEICSKPDCNKPVRAKGLCLRHYRQRWYFEQGGKAKTAAAHAARKRSGR